MQDIVHFIQTMQDTTALCGAPLAGMVSTTLPATALQCRACQTRQTGKVLRIVHHVPRMPAMLPSMPNNAYRLSHFYSR